MNIEQAKAISLYELLIKLGFKPTRENANESWFLSPLRDEKTASFHVNTKKNIWYDFGDARGGDIIDFVCAYLEKSEEASNVPDALRYISNMSGCVPTIAAVTPREAELKEPKLIVKSVGEINRLALVYYLKGRHVSVDIAKSYLMEVLFQNKETGKDFYALGFKNEDGGYELRNPFFKGCAGKKAVSFVRGTIPKPKGIHIFEGFMDYLSILTDLNRDRLDDDAIILNSLSCLKQATSLIKNYGYEIAWTWMDNDDAGNKATQAFTDFFKTEKIDHRPMNESYTPHKDVNAWLVKKLTPSE